MGLWLLQRCQKDWAAAGNKHDYNELVEMAKQSMPFHCWLDPDDPVFLNPQNMPGAIVDFCKRTNQPPLQNKAQFVRAVLESLALKYRHIIEMINAICPNPVEVIHIVGGGTKNELLNQFTADATGVTVITGPVEATAAGNIISQAIAKGEIANFDDGRELAARSFPGKAYHPGDTERWSVQYEQIKSHFR